MRLYAVGRKRVTFHLSGRRNTWIYHPQVREGLLADTRLAAYIKIPVIYLPMNRKFHDTFVHAKRIIRIGSVCEMRSGVITVADVLVRGSDPGGNRFFRTRPKARDRWRALVYTVINLRVP
jgi:hypothetical protein